MNRQPMLFSGSSHLNLSKDICKRLNIEIGKMRLSQFPDGETDVQILEEVRGRDVYVLQSMARQPGHYLFELLIIIDALKRSSARRITAVIPYLGYCRQDRKSKPGTPITAKLVANVLTTAGIHHLITCNLHAEQVEGFFEIPVDHLQCQKILSEAAKNLIDKDCIVVAPDIGSSKIAETMAKCLGTELVIVKKERLNAFEVSPILIGSVRNKNVIITDDLCSTGGTLVATANLCREQGAKKIIGAVPHGLFAGEAIERIKASALEVLIITDTIESEILLPSFIQTTSVASLVAAAINDLWASGNA